ncbi:cytochrome P450 [Sphingomonas sp. M6A6_1c]
MTAAAQIAAARARSLARLLDPEIHADPHVLYRKMRDHGPVIWDPYLHTWIVTGYAEAVIVFQEFLSTRTPSADTFVRMGLPMLTPAAAVMRRQMMFMDEPRHLRVRTACSALFTASRVKRLEERMRDICRELLAGMEDGERWDLHGGFAEPLPAMITTEIVGLPSGDWRQLQRWADDFAALIGNFHQSVAAGDRSAASLAAMTTYIAAAITSQRRGERHGLIGALVSQNDGDALDDDEIVANVIITLVGGLGTATNLISSGVATLCVHREAERHLRQNSAALRGAVEELLRFETPSQFTGRIAPGDRLLGGEQIREGDAVMVMTAAANRDRSVFDDPDAFDIHRMPNRHLAFAWGPHFCFGATLARIEAAAALDELLKHTSALRLSGEPLSWRQNLGLRGLTRLDVVATLAGR